MSVLSTLTLPVHPTTVCHECANHGFVPDPFDGRELLPCPTCSGEAAPQTAPVDLDHICRELEILALDADRDAGRSKSAAGQNMFGGVAIGLRAAMKLLQESYGVPADLAAVDEQDDSAA